jgi:copper(I)-binding protein
MSETIDTTSDRPRRPRKAKATDIEVFQAWLMTLANSPKLHINGPNFGTAVLAVDFGSPIADDAKLASEQVGDLVNRMRSLTKTLIKDREVTVRIQSDSSTGVWWSAIS